MTIHRINTFTAKSGTGEQLAKAFRRVLPKIKNAEGCLACTLFQSAEHADKVIIMEEWRSKEDHKQAANIIKKEDLAVIMSLLAEKPKGEYLNAL